MSRLRHLSDALLPLMLPHLWSSTLFLLIVLAVGFALRNRLTAAGRYALALAGIVKFALPAAFVAAPLRALFAPARPLLRIPLQYVAGTAALPNPAAIARLWPAVAAGLWAIVALAIVVRTIIVQRRLVALSVHTALPPLPREVEALRRAKRRTGVKASIDIARSPVPEAPAVLRVFRPVIVLPPTGCDDLSDEELESLLCHECAHVARHDNLMASLESIICALFWFHPLIWIAQRITRIERERACDEAVAGSADERETYLTALSKFCHAAIAPRLAGVSCMATARLKERMDHVMNYPALRTLAPPARRVALFAAISLVLFTIGAGLVGSSALAGPADTAGPRYAVRISASQANDNITLTAEVIDNESHQVVVAPKLTFHAGEPAQGHASVRDAAGREIDLDLDVRPDGDSINVTATINQDGRPVQTAKMRMTPTTGETTTANYSGAPISMDLKDADLRDVINTFGKLTGMKMDIAPDVQGRISVHWRNVPWDEAFASMLTENGCAYRVDGKTIVVTRK